MSTRMFLVILLWVTTACSAPVSTHPNRVINLPGAPLLPVFPMYSGFLNASSDGSSRCFYILVESIRVDPSTAPLLIWFNGGPGGSSLHGFFSEHGPYRLTETGEVLTYNEFSWNQYANVMYFESPLGVGFSQNKEGNLTTNDSDAAEFNFNALKDFMTRVHPNYADREYYLTGQSYAGAYAPYLSRRLLNGIETGEMRNKNFKGFAIGSPVFENISRNLAKFMQYISYGLLTDKFNAIVSSMWEKLQRGGKVYFGQNSPVHYNFVEHCYSNKYEGYHGSTAPKSIACYESEILEPYMNRVDVQTALHVRNISDGITKWSSFNLAYDDFYNRDHNVLPIYDDIFRLVNGSSFRVLIYNGDTDVMLPPLHAITNTEKIAAANYLEDQNYPRAWRFFDDFAGIRNGYRNRSVTMDMLTVRGAGHSVPTDLPAQAFQMINNFILTKEGEEIDYSKPIKKH